MALKDTIKNMKDLLNTIAHDLQKSDNGNKAASQRVRTGTVKLEKIAKLYRKESIKGEKSNSPRSAKKPAKKAAPKKAAPSKPVKKSKSPAKAPVKSTVKTRSKAKAHRAHPRAMSFKRPSAKLPSRAFALK